MTIITIITAIIMATITVFGFLPGQLAIITSGFLFFFNGIKAFGHFKSFNSKRSDVSYYEVMEQDEITKALTATGIFSMLLLGSGFYGLESYSFEMSKELYLFSSGSLFIFFSFNQKLNVLFSRKKVLYSELERQKSDEDNRAKKKTKVMPIETISNHLKDFSKELDETKNSLIEGNAQQSQCIEKLRNEFLELKRQIDRLDIESNPKIKISKS